MNLRKAKRTVIDLRRCRVILGSDCPLTDGQVELLRDQLAAFADIALETAIQELRIGSRDLIGAAARVIPECQSEEIVERASIMEFDGGVSRAIAENAALRNYATGQRKPGRSN